MPSIRNFSRAELFTIFKSDQAVRLVEELIDAINNTIPADVTVVAADLAAHIADPADAHAASAIGNAPAGSIAATTVQGALNELDAEKQPLDATLTALAALVTAADRLIYATGVDAFALTTFTAFARTLLDDVDAATMRTTLGLVIGTNVQAWDADLDTWATKAPPAGVPVGTTDAQTLASKTLTAPVINNPTGAMTLASGTLGYAAGNGGAVTQITSKSTGVTLNKIAGEITMDGSALAANTAVSFTLTNSTIAATDRIIPNHVGAGTFGAYHIDFRPAGGSATVVVRNLTGGSLSEAIVIGFTVIKSANT